MAKIYLYEYIEFFNKVFVYEFDVKKDGSAYKLSEKIPYIVSARRIIEEKELDILCSYTKRMYSLYNDREEDFIKKLQGFWGEEIVKLRDKVEKISDAKVEVCKI